MNHGAKPDMKEMSFVFSFARTTLKSLGANEYDFGSLFFSGTRWCQEALRLRPGSKGPSAARAFGRCGIEARRSNEIDALPCTYPKETDPRDTPPSPDWPVNCWFTPVERRVSVTSRETRTSRLNCGQPVELSCWRSLRITRSSDPQQERTRGRQAFTFAPVVCSPSCAD